MEYVKLCPGFWVFLFAIHEFWFGVWFFCFQSGRDLCNHLIWFIYCMSQALWSEKARKPLTPGASFSPPFKLVTRIHVYRGEEGTRSGLWSSRDCDAHSDANSSVIRTAWGTRKKIFKTSLVNYRHYRWCPAISSFLLILIPFKVATPGRRAYLFYFFF